MTWQMTFSYSKYALICIISMTIWIIFNRPIYITLRPTIFKSSAAAPVLLLLTYFFIYLKCPQTDKLMHLLIIFAFYLSGGFFHDVSSSYFFCHLLSDLSKTVQGIISDSSLSLTTFHVVSSYHFIHSFISPSS